MGRIFVSMLQIGAFLALLAATKPSAVADFQTIKDCNSYRDNDGCKLWNLYSIPFIFDHVSTKFKHWIDGKSALNCLHGKKLLFLGDSTMKETVVDIGGLLLNISTNSSIFQDYFGYVVPQSPEAFLFANDTKGMNREFSTDPNIHSIAISFVRNYRNMTISSKSLNATIRFRFTGHHVLHGNGLGLKTFFMKQFDEEFNCLLGLNPGCPRPDVIVLNSGLHDIAGDMKVGEFKWRLRGLLGRIHSQFKKFHKMRAKIIWKSLFLDPSSRVYNQVRLFDQAAFLITQEMDTIYVNITKMISYLPMFSSNRRIYTDGVHFKRQTKFGVCGALSTLVSQQLLKTICTSLKDIK